jgi:hypothetical protein
VVSPTVTTVYTVTGTIPGCAVTASTSGTVNVNPLPSLSLSLNNPAFCLQQVSVGLLGNPSGGAFSGPFVSGSVFSPTAIGTYTIAYNYTNAATGCSNKVNTVVIVPNCVGIGELSFAGAPFTLYPNPAGDQVSVFFGTASPGRELEMFDSEGKKVMTVNAAEIAVKIDLGRLNKGMYFVKVQGQGGQGLRLIRD